MVARWRKLLAVLTKPDWRRAFLRYGVAAGTEHFVVLSKLGNLRTVVDIGANRGQFALVARHCFKSARIISFEPLAGPAMIFGRLFRRDSLVELHQTAIGPLASDALMHISARDDSSSLLPILPAQTKLFPGTEERATTLIRIDRLSHYLQSHVMEAPALLKLDVQGFELQALTGCEDLLHRFEWVYAECSFAELYEGQALADEVIAWLRDRGLKLRGAYNVVCDADGQMIQADFLFRKQGLAT